MKKFALVVTCFSIYLLFTQYSGRTPADRWVDSVSSSLSKEEKIAQLMVIRAHSNLGPDHVQQVTDLIKNYNVGALCFFQGGPVRQANLTNFYQSISKTPLMVTIDGEWGLGMRLDSVLKYPFQSTLGALQNDKLVYEMGVDIGEQMKRMGVQVNYAPVVDINNNPANPVIGYRSFGEDKYKVAQLGVAYMRGMQSAGIMACAKHFPGHGDVAVDSHLDLPVINKSREQLDSLELYPFKQLFKAGVGSVMIAHLSVPSIDNAPNRPTSLSKNNVTDLLRDDLYYEGLTFTDALEMKGVAKYFGGGEAAVEALIAGNDMLCLPENVPAAIDAVKKAIKEKRLSWDVINKKVQRVLYAKYQLGLDKAPVIDTTNLLTDLNARTEGLRQRVAANVITVMQNKAGLLPFVAKNHMAYVGLGTAELNTFGQRLKADFNTDTYLLPYNDSTGKAGAILEAIKGGNYDRIVIGLHNYSNKPAGNYGISPAAIDLVSSLQAYNAVTFVFGNVYAAQNFCSASTLVAMYEDDGVFQNAAADFLQGKLSAKGTLPVSVCDLPYGSGIALNTFVPVGNTPAWAPVDAIAQEGLVKKAYPGAVVLAVQNGVIKYHKAFGHYAFDPASPPVTLESIYDLASVTKVSATTISLMKLYDEGKLDLNKTLGDYLPITVGTDKAPLLIKDVLLHQAGLNPYISFYKETIENGTGQPSPAFYHENPDSLFSIPVARNVWLRRDWNDTMLKRIVDSKLGPHGKYVYSDNDFILLGKVVEAISGLPLDQYVQNTFYRPMGLASTGFKPWQRFTPDGIVPTEEEKYFRKQLLQGYVHDEGAAMFGGVSGHAGLFSNAYDLAMLYQMLLNGGSFNGEHYLKKETIDLFTAYHSENSRRGYGFDKPEKDNATRKEPYPSALASPETFGHTGFTGTCVWVDPKADIVYIFLSNRVYNTRANNLLGQLNIRGRLQDAIYKVLEQEQKGTTVKGF
ncbi:glycoside hydrolase family 3 N-terminal domain-containing protein [Flavisolibacter nicotianae]|uniref:glycoside hydrolase family 3 N-terminal domain-containing protein n=1 Tax=Flavisolibacter nicotianae TaxID=2364882 RepID=UPI000EAD60D6|nr:glycoside hydrolase family 3 N-terminal domain-containing protein [Flavisolibacter nicotianae]